MIGLAAALAALTAQPGPPPIDQRPGRLSEVSLRLDRIDIRVVEYRRLLWEGSVRVNRMNSGQYSERHLDAAAPPCARLSSSAATGYELSVEVRKYGGNATDRDNYAFVIQLQRVRPGDDCRPVTTLFTVNRDARLDPGQTVELPGNGPLRVQVSRPLRRAPEDAAPAWTREQR